MFGSDTLEGYSHAWDFEVSDVFEVGRFDTSSRTFKCGDEEMKGAVLMHF